MLRPRARTSAIDSNGTGTDMITSDECARTGARDLLAGDVPAACADLVRAGAHLDADRVVPTVVLARRGIAPVVLEPLDRRASSSSRTRSNAESRPHGETACHDAPAAALRTRRATARATVRRRQPQVRS